MRRGVQILQLSRLGLDRLRRVNGGLHREAKRLNEPTALFQGANDLSECKAVIGDDINSREI